ncbi:MAG: efflux transporter periplasmic adaptor subunit [Lysobacterales bacterium RIFOXYA1_FULL_69_10]|nr:MAG: efflux transporter periplasmic adaptor subunit [Xanthomonadales bacterium RIFOXYA1_FULL_69_10]
MREQRAEAAGSGYRTETVERGDVRVSISATGTLAAISTVDIGSQVSGQVTEVLADFNDRVARDQVIARIDPSTFDAQIAQGDAGVRSARASLATAQATLRNAQADYTRKAALADDQLVARADADLARAALDQARAQVGAAQAEITRQLASTQTSRLNLQRTVIRSPVDGVVLTRTVEPGMTVAASLQSPVLFQIAEDLSKMEIVLAIDEADIGQVRVGQGVGFSVDAFPDRQFRGEVQQVRLAATNTNNVITYPVVVAVDNRDEVLLPGMTANAEIEVSRRDDVLRVSNAALRWKPAEDGDAPAAEAGAMRGRGDMSGDLSNIADGLSLTAEQRAVFDREIEAMRERQAAQAAQAAARAGASGSTSTPNLFGGGRGGNRRAGGGTGASAAMRQRMLERIQAQFSGFAASLSDAQRERWQAELLALAGARRAPLYRLVDGQPQRVMVRVGASDGASTEVTGVEDGDRVIVGIERDAG